MDLTDEASQVPRNKVPGPGLLTMSLSATRAGGVGGAGPRGKACLMGAQLNELQAE